MFAKTGTIPGGPESNSQHLFEISASGLTKSVPIPCSSSSTCSPGASTVFHFEMSDFGFTDQNNKQMCIKKGDITKVTIRAGGGDGWRIESISITATTCKGTIPITFDGMLNHWIDGNELPSYLFRDLTLYKPTLA